MRQHFCLSGINQYKHRARQPRSELGDIGRVKQAAEKTGPFVIPSGARNLSWVSARGKKERFLAPLGMKK
jgi:hypothetical protein